ncbi:transcription factor CPC-like [Phoenix dactylifera]|uniref:Transcription factor CPC-like n=1 Tax=Phoenix dactylifera TaxID=42345 RepID=A0A8B7CQM6_PHODC|nr:transcription factor CPC-like [Phoenix dactylifera]
MGDLDQSSEDVSVDSRGTIFATDGNSQDIKVDFTEDEETLIARMYGLLGDRWSLIAGRIPGRTAEEIEKYWTSRYSNSE